MTTWKQPFSINKIAQMLIPFRHRQLRMIAWVKVFVSYLIYVKESLEAFWDSTWLDAVITPQVAYLEKRLNLAFDCGNDIYIAEGRSLGPYIFLPEETADPVFYMDEDDSWVYTDTESAEVDFTVWITEAQRNYAPQIAALVHRFKLPGKSFIIQIHS